MNGMELDFVFASNEAGVAKAREHIHAFSRAAGLSDRKCEDIRQAMSEAINNAVEHAYRWRRGEVAVRISVDGAHVIGVIADRGRWNAAEKADRGRGDTIMQALCSLFERTSGPDGTVVTMTFAVMDAVSTERALVRDDVPNAAESSYST